jgi:hypothetical protein
MSTRRWRGAAVVVLGLVLCAALAGFAYNIPFVQDHLGWRVAELRASIKYAISPPGEAVFTPNPTLAAMVLSTLAAMTPTPSLSPTAGPTSTPTITATPTVPPTPLPASIRLKGVIHEYQKWNNCGPANLAMALSYWGWVGDQRDTAAYMKPNPRDKNVMPYEMANFVQDKTGFKIVVRVGGDLNLLKQFLAGGFPVIVEKGFDVPGKEWMGHYEVLTGYDDAKDVFIGQDSYIIPDLPIPYDQLQSDWRAFNYTYLVIYPPDRETEVLDLLGPQADETVNYQAAAKEASDEIYRTSGRDQFFAWFNRGTNLVWLRDYAGAAAAYDEAYKIDATLAATDPGNRPWRILWYETGPYFAYFYTDRYIDVINLATQTLVNSSEPALEESWYWRAMARAATGDLSAAADDLRTSLTWHPGFAPSLAELQQLGATP